MSIGFESGLEVGHEGHIVDHFAQNLLFPQHAFQRLVLSKVFLFDHFQSVEFAVGAVADQIDGSADALAHTGQKLEVGESRSGIVSCDSFENDVQTLVVVDASKFVFPVLKVVVERIVAVLGADANHVLVFKSFPNGINECSDSITALETKHEGFFAALVEDLKSQGLRASG
jgi:hypothetical protein